MTLGERIAALRKEKGLSQEALGELVGVSRQAVSKWEADRTVPDINNCITMSKIFGISLAHLLELEEQADIPDAALAQEHLKLVEEITAKYAAAQKRAHRRWRWPIILLACALLIGAAWLWEWLNNMNRTIQYLSGEIAGLQGEIVSGVGDRVQESLDAERSLITDYSTDVISADVIENTVTYALSVNLKEGGENTAVSFMSYMDGNSVIVPAVHQGGLIYTGEIICPIQDGAIIHLIVEEDGQSRSHPLETNSFESDYAIRLSGDVRWAAFSQSSLSDTAYEPVEIFVSHEEGPGLPEPLTLTQLEIALLNNEAIVDILPIDLALGSKHQVQWNLHQEIDIPVDVSVKHGDTLTFALLARDNYGRETSCILSRYRVTEGGRFESLPHERMELDNGTYGTEVWE